MPNIIITYADPVRQHEKMCELSRNGYGAHEVIHAKDHHHLARIIHATKAKNFIAVLEQQPTKAERREYCQLQNARQSFEMKIDSLKAQIQDAIEALNKNQLKLNLIQP